MAHLIFDTEIIGKENPRFLTCVINAETKERHAFWLHRRGHMKKLEKLLLDPDNIWVGFNSQQFDLSLVSAATDGVDEFDLKQMATEIIEQDLMWWDTSRAYDFDLIDLDHIDIFNVAPGVKISLKTYQGRMGMKNIVDMPFHHDEDITPRQLKVVEKYCFNDCDATLELFQRLETELSLRDDLTKEFGIDLRSKSDAQVAEAVLKHVVGIRNSDKIVPSSVSYTAPDFIQTKSDVLNDLIDELETTRFKINRANGNLIAPDFLDTPLQLGSGSYQCGVGGLHSTHDKSLHRVAGDGVLISDFDVASYYPNIMINAGIIPILQGNKGEMFLDTYRGFYERRIEAKRTGDKRVSNSLKIFLNGTFGKLGSIFCAFYSPDLLLAVTLTGQLNLLCLIYELEKIRGVKVLSANTDGIMVEFSEKTRERVLKVFQRNAKRTGFEYEETPYRTIAMKDVNNYLAITTDAEASVINSKAIKRFPGSKDEVKSKGEYASNRPEENPLYLMKNPTMEVCSRMASDYLRYGWLPEDAIHEYRDMSDFVAIRAVKGGGVQHLKTKIVDDWELIEDHDSAKNVWYSKTSGKSVKRKSRPKPFEMGIGGTPFGRVARWYMTTKNLPPISYVGSGNKVPRTDGAMLCMTLPDELPSDLDFDWYIQETRAMLKDMGVVLE